MLTHIITLESDVEPEPLRSISEHDVEDATAVIHVVNIHDFDALEENTRAGQPTNETRNKLLFTLFFSILLHALAFYIISLRIQLPRFSEETEKPVIIKAKLYTPPPPAAIVQPEPAIPEPITLPEVDSQTIPDESTGQQTIKEDVLTEEQVPEPPATNEAPIPEPEAVITEPEVPTIEQVEKPTLPIPSARPKSIYSTRAATDLRALQQQKLNNMMDRAVREFQYNRTHPEIKTAPKTPLQLTAEEKSQIADQQLQKDIEVSVDCKKRGAKVLSSISRLTGGTAKCQKTPAFQSFIKKRLDKSNIQERK